MKFDIKKEPVISGIVIASLLAMVIQLFAYPYVYQAGISNVVYYVMLCLVFIVTAYASASVMNTKMNLDKTHLNSFFIVLGLAFLGWFAMMYVTEPWIEYFDKDYVLRHQVHPGLYFIGLAGVALLTGFLLLTVKGNHSIFKIIISVIVTILQTACLWAPNIIADRGGTLFHIHAYFNPIYNAVDFIPYSNLITSIYGHYSLFYILPVRFLMLFGIPKVYAVMIFTMVVGAATFLLLYILLEKIIKNDVLFILTVLGSAYLSFESYYAGQYYQLLPHRLFFPVLILFVSWMMLNKKCPKFVGWVVSGLAMLWNFETGIICTLIMCGVFFILEYAIYGNEKKRSVGVIVLLDALYGIAAFAGGYLFLNLFNLIIGGKALSILDYIFPIASKEFVVEGLALKLQDISAVYFMEILLFLGLFVYFILRTLKKTISIKDSMILILSVMGLGMLTYYMNRAAYNNISISHICFVGVMALLLQKMITQQSDDSLLKKVVLTPTKFVPFTVLVIMLSFYVLGSVTNVKGALDFRKATVWDMYTIDFLTEEIKTFVPENVTGAGVGISDLYSLLGWDNDIKVMDYADFASCPSQVEYVKVQLSEVEVALIQKDTYEELYSPEDWIVISNLESMFYYCASYDYEHMDKPQGICNFAEEYELDRETLLDLLTMNFLGGTVSGEQRQNLLGRMTTSEGALEVAYELWFQGKELKE